MKFCFVSARQFIDPSEFLEAVYVHKSKSIAVAGEDIPFLVDIRWQNNPTFSKMAYADLINRQGKRVAGAIIPLQEGKAAAYLSIPSTIPSDHYLFRVYTRLASSMEDEQNYHHSLITVIHPHIPPIGKKQSSNAWEASQVKNAVQFSLHKEVLALGEMAELTITAPPGKNLTISISRKNPFLGDMKAIIPARETKFSSKEELIPEIQGHIIKGTLSETAIDSSRVYFLSAHGEKSNLFLGRPNKNGEVFFELGALKEYDFLLLQTEQDNVPFGMSIEQPFAPVPSGDILKFPALQLDEKDLGLLNDLVISHAATAYYLKPEQQSIKAISTKFDVDKSYVLDEYVRFEDLATTLKEYVPTVMVRTNDDKYHFKLTNFPEDRMFKDNPLMLIDGMPVFDSDAFGRHGADSIESIGVVNRKFYLLDNIFEGLINIKSYSNDFGGFPIPESALYLEYPSIQQPVNWHFNTSVDEERGALPDFRTILFWEENIRMDKDGEVKVNFITSQSPGEYEVKVSSISDDGKQSWSKLDFKVLRE
ncbi:hypothetical protein [Echinicola salinicaeni]|uniref:hypothetical protein n=1 Tax=Echinicola salinicaeni TaxID=2762757 RepID=UPI00164493C8|nr:hypothetical protein [Echinicola salinicaeni]